MSLLGLYEAKPVQVDYRHLLVDETERHNVIGQKDWYKKGKAKPRRRRSLKTKIKQKTMEAPPKKLNKSISSRCFINARLGTVANKNRHQNLYFFFPQQRMMMRSRFSSYSLMMNEEIKKLGAQKGEGR